MTTRYQVDATISSGIGWKITPEMSRARPYSSRLNGTAATRLVVLSMLMTSLPVGGMITRIACGSTVLRMVCDHVMPSATDASYTASRIRRRAAMSAEYPERGPSSTNTSRPATW